MPFSIKEAFKTTMKVYIMYSFPILSSIIIAPEIYRETKKIYNIYNNAKEFGNTLNFYNQYQQRGFNYYANT